MLLLDEVIYNAACPPHKHLRGMLSSNPCTPALQLAGHSHINQVEACRAFLGVGTHPPQPYHPPSPPPPARAHLVLPPTHTHEC
jgi:hypothetical protein